MTKKCIVSILLLLLIIGGGAYKFLLQGSVSSGTDGRISIHLSAAERDLVLAEMRAFLESVQQVTRGIAAEDMQAVIVAAQRSGRAAQAEVPASLVGKLPMAFKRLGFDTHSKFDQLAMDGKDLEDGGHSLTQLATLMENCVACHASYRFEVEAE